MIQKNFDDIGKSDIEALIDNGVTESKVIEYKQELPGRSDDDKKEFLADVSSFGNASGGDIIYGIKEAVDGNGKKTGAPEKVMPVTGQTADEAKLRLEGTIRDGIEPRLRVQIKEIAGWGEDGRGFVVLVRIPQSFASPHMVTFKKTSRFFSRNSAGKYPLDVQEIRSAFLATDSQAERIKRFRQDRLDKIVSDETPIALMSAQRLVLHVIPIASFLNNVRLDMSKYTTLLNAFPPIMGRSQDFRYNLDGLLVWIPDAEQNVTCSYCQVFSTGVLEAVGAGWVLGGVTEDKRQVIADDYENHVVEAVESYLSGYKKLGITPPLAIALSLMGCKGSVLHSRRIRRAMHQVDRDAVILPEVVIDSLDVEVPQSMKPLFDSVWNASGFPRSYNYDEEGKWSPER